MSRFLRGRFPSWAKQYREWSLTEPRVPSPPDILDFVRAAKKGAVVLEEQVPGFVSEDPTWGERWDVPQMLTRFGLMQAPSPDPLSGDSD
eukprot:5797458-Pyramimonas_sp.AAC.1